MKKRFKVIQLMPILLTLNLAFSNAQSTGEPLQLRPFGLGLHVEQYKLLDAYTSGNYVSLTNNILIILNAGQHFRIEPEFGIMSIKSEDSDDMSRGISLGTGFFGMFNKKDVNFYFGARINYSRAKMIDESDYDDENDIEQKYTVFKYGPTIGAEYYFSPHFSFGGEIAYKFSTTKTEIEGIDDDSKASFTNTETGLFVRFFF